MEFLDLPAGESQCWLTDVAFVRGTNDKPKNKITLYIASEPTKVSHTSPSTRYDIYLPLSSDSTQAKIAMEKRIKAVLYPLAGFTIDKKCSIKELFEAIKANVTTHDLNLTVDVSHKPGNTLDKNGNQRVFVEINTVSPTGFEEKAPYESDIGFDDQDVPF